MPWSINLAHLTVSPLPICWRRPRRWTETSLTTPLSVPRPNRTAILFNASLSGSRAFAFCHTCLVAPMSPSLAWQIACATYISAHWLSNKPPSSNVRCNLPNNHNASRYSPCLAAAIAASRLYPAILNLDKGASLFANFWPRTRQDRP